MMRHILPRLRSVQALAAALVAGILVVVMWGVGKAGEALVVCRSIESPDAIISLGSHEWERLPAAARLANAYPRALVLLTEPPEVTELNCHDCANRVQRLQTMGVRDDRVRILRVVGSGTYGEARATAAFAPTAGIRRLAIVTSPYHTRRALAIFRRVFAGQTVQFGIECATTEPPITPGTWWRTPYDRAYVPYELAAIPYYVWKYGVRLTDLERP